MTAAFSDLVTRAGLDPGPGAVFTPLTGGLSHRVLRLDAGAAPPRVLRILDPAVGEAQLGIPAADEVRNTIAAGRTGVGPRVLGSMLEPPLLVTEFIEGRTLSAEDVANPDVLVRIAAACRRLHACPEPFAPRFDPFRKARGLLGLCLRRGLAVPDGYLARYRTFARIERALAVSPLPDAPCHNDLLPANLIDDGRTVRIVDYQLSGTGDPAFDLGDLAAEARLDPDLVDLLATAYFGAEMHDALLARVRLFAIASDIAWTLWFVVHHGLLADSAAAPAYDYAAEASGKWSRAEQAMDSPDFGALLDRAGRPTP